MSSRTGVSPGAGRFSILFVVVVIGICCCLVTKSWQTVLLPHGL